MSLRGHETLEIRECKRNEKLSNACKNQDDQRKAEAEEIAECKSDYGNQE